MRHIVLLTGNALCNNPRARKEAEALAAAGFKVTILGAWMSDESKQRDLELLRGAPYAFEAILNAADPDPGSIAMVFLARAKTGSGRKLHQLLGVESRWQLGYTVDLLLQRAKQFDADLFIAHSEPALHAARELHRQGRRIGVDMEDWFSEDLLPESRRGRPLNLLRALERDVLLKASHATCPSAAMSQALAERYGCAEPTVVYNAFPWADRKLLDGKWKDRRREGRPSIHWYSQTMGPGRGLEELLAALPALSVDAEVHLRGHSATEYREHLLHQLAPPLRDRLHFHDPVPGPELLSRIAEHDIGYSGEIDAIPSRNLTVTNKILHYLLAGVPAVASDTAGSREVAGRAPAAAFIWRAGIPRELVAMLDSLLRNPENLAKAKPAALAAAESAFCWERCAPALVASIESALARPSG